MRTMKILLIAGPLLFWTGAFVPAQMPLGDCAVAVAQQDPPAAPAEQPAAQPQQPAAPPPNVDVTVDNGGQDRILFLANPWVLATAGVALLIAIALIAMSTRGGGTTIVRESKR